MLTYQKNIKNIDAKMTKTKNDRLNLSSKCSVCGSKRSRFMKKQDAEGLLSNVGVRTPLSKILLLNILF